MEKQNDSIFPDLLTSETTPEIRIADKRICFYCQSSPISDTQTLCPVCRFPQNGLGIEQEAFIAEARDKAARHLQLEIIIGRAQTLMMVAGFGVLIMAGANFLLDVLSDRLRDQFIDQFLYFALAALPNIGLWYWSKKKPYPAILTAFILTLAGAAAQYTIESFSLTSLIVLLFELLILAHALVSYKEAVEIEEELIFKPQHLSQ